MKHNTELEEGEACCYSKDEDNIDLDSLSYIVRTYLNMMLAKFNFLHLNLV